jgi:hypothetical protein
MQGVASGSWPALAGAPTIGTATAGALSASVAFTAPTYTGSGITGYTATSSPGGFTGTGASSPVTVSGLTAGTAYTFTVTATTAAGQGPASAASNSVTPTAPSYIEDVFSTYLYTGNGSTQTITNGIDTSTKGGMVWIKSRSLATSNQIQDTVRGASKSLFTNTAGAELTQTQGFSAFGTSGFSLYFDNLSSGSTNNSGSTYASWTFREQPKFFDIVSWTGDNVPNRVINHNLGSTPGCIIIKQLNVNGNNWVVWHRSLTSSTYSMYLDLTDAQANNGWIKDQTSTTFTVNDQGNELVNGSGYGYIAYLFAHDAGGFGLTGTDNVISCGSMFNGDAVNLGYEPQWVLFKRTNGTSNWYLYDNMRKMPVSGNSQVLWPNLSDAENATVNYVSPNATGFNFASPGGTGAWIYIAIRRGPMKVPTSGTSVFGITTAAGTSPAYVSSFPVDVALRKQITTGDPTLQARLTGPTKMFTDYTFDESSDSNVTWDYQNGMFTTTGANSDQYGYLMRRAPSYMDVVCYSGTGVARTVNHNLAAVPELMIVKLRNNYDDWYVYSKSLSLTEFLVLNTNQSKTSSALWNTAPTSTVFGLSSAGNVNANGYTYITYLFATCAGVSKVGSYTGNGSTQTLDCGFTGGARFVLIKRTDNTGDWYVYDTVRGMTVLTNPYWFLNTNAAQVATLGSVTTVSTGFAVNATVLAAINTNAASYIFLAIA